MTTVHWGQALSFTGEYSNGLPVVTSYNGSNFCGITNQTVVNIDSPHVGAMTTEGGVINIIQAGIIRIRRLLVTNPEKVAFNKYVRPHKKGWKIQKRRTKKSVGVVCLASDDILEINLL